MQYYFSTHWLFCAFTLFVLVVSTLNHGHLPHQLRALRSPSIQRRQNVSNFEIQEAQKLMDAAVAQQGLYNAWRVDHPLRNTYVSRHSAEAKANKNKRDNAPVPPTLNTTILAAAVLLAEHNAALQNANGTLHDTYDLPETMNSSTSGSAEKRDTTDYWVSSLDRTKEAWTGHASMGSDSSYQVFRNVKSFGAVGDGLTDDTAAINSAIDYQSNCGAGCESSSIKGTLIFFPPGTYLISTPINAYYYTQLVGDPNDFPVIKTSKDFIGLGAIQSDVYVASASGGEWYVEQSNFYRQVRNLFVNTRLTVTDKMAAFHWQVAQATSMTNVYIFLSLDDGNTQMGLFTENGSGGFMSDVNIAGGKYGIYGGNQQYTVRNFVFSSQSTAAICLLWDWGWTWSGLQISGTPIGILLINPEAPDGPQAGSIYVLDSLFVNVDVVVKANFMSDTILDTSIITLDNLGVLNVKTIVEFADGDILAIPVENTNFVIIGNAEVDGAIFGMYTVNVLAPAESLTSAFSNYRNNYFAKSRPQYGDLSLDSIISVKDHGALGDGVHDDTAAIVAALALATTNNLIYFPSGSYIVTDTIVIPANTRMTGEVWSQLVASGSHFTDMINPRTMIQVGNEGDVGVVEISDIIFTSIGALPGLVMVEWNVAASEQGSVGMWDAHFRVGGAYGTELQVAQCPKLAPIQVGCIAASLMFHVTPNSNGYFENVWAWVADHDIDDATNTQVTIAVARGMLIESAGPTWMLGTASEHSILYQYNFIKSANTFTGMIQTESPYFQYALDAESPGPFNFSVGIFENDPVFPDPSCSGTDLMCNTGWAVMIEETTNLTIAGAGLYSWFANYDQDVCVDAQDCQQRLVYNGGSNGGLYFWNLITIGGVEMISNIDTGDVIYAANNTQTTGHPFWSALGAYLDDYEDTTSGVTCDDDDTSAECQTKSLCDRTISFATVAAVQAAISTFDTSCTDFYVLGALYNTLNADLANYTAVDDGYDAVFGDYVTYTKELIPALLGTFMGPSTPSDLDGGDGNKYFDCTYTVDGGSESPVQQCPIGYGVYAFHPRSAWVTTYTLRDSDGFYSDLSKNYGIAKDSVAFGDTPAPVYCNAPNPRYDICGSVGQVNAHQAHGIPVSASDITVTNPKDIISNALPQIASMKNTILARLMDISTSSWDGSNDDVIQVISMPVFLISQAIEAMATAKSLGEQEKIKLQKEKVALILEILGIVFAFIPFLDELVTPELEIADGVFNIVADVGNVGLAVQSILADPASAPMDILSALSFGRVKTKDEYSATAAARRGVDSDDLLSIGKLFQADDAEMQKVVKNTCALR